MPVFTALIMASFSLTSPKRIVLSRLAFSLCLSLILWVEDPVAAATVSVDKDHQSVLVITDTNAIHLQPWSSGTIRVEAAPGTTIPEKKSLTVIATPNPASWEMTEKADSSVSYNGSVITIKAP